MSRGIVSEPKEAAPLVVGQLWFIATSLDSNNIDLYEITGLWSKVVCLSRPNSRSEPRYYLVAGLRFVEQVQR